LEVPNVRRVRKPRSRPSRDIRGEIAQFHSATRSEFADVRSELRSLRADVASDMIDLEKRLNAQIAGLRRAVM
jgi:hypothetical protein